MAKSSDSHYEYGQECVVDIIWTLVITFFREGKYILGVKQTLLHVKITGRASTDATDQIVQHLVHTNNSRSHVVFSLDLN